MSNLTEIINQVNKLLDISDLNNKTLTQRVNKDSGKEEWCLVSKKNKRVLRWYGSTKPSDETVAKDERRIEWFKRND